MSALPSVPSRCPLTWISDHAIIRFCEHIDPQLDPERDRESICRMIRRMYRCSRVATETQLRMMRVRIDWTDTYLISDTSAGLHLLILHDGTLKTVRPLGDQR